MIPSLDAKFEHPFDEDQLVFCSDLERAILRQFQSTSKPHRHRASYTLALGKLVFFICMLVGLGTGSELRLPPNIDDLVTILAKKGGLFGLLNPPLLMTFCDYLEKQLHYGVT